MAGIKPTVTIEVELAGVGGGYTSLSADAIKGSLVIRHGINGGGPTDRCASTGHCSFSLDNSASNSGLKLGYYSLYHANKRAGWALGINCRVRLQDPTTSTQWTRFAGRIDAIEPLPGKKMDRVVKVVAVDWIDEAAVWAITPDVGPQVDQRGDQIITTVLAQMPRQPVATSFDAGNESYAFALDTSENARTPALAEFSKLALSEMGFIFVTAAGTLRYENRHQRMTDVAIDWTILDTQIQGLALPSKRDEILNTIRTTVHAKLVDASADNVVYNQTNPIAIPGGGGSKTILGPYRDQVSGNTIGATAVQTLIATTDYLASLTPDGGTDITADIVIVVTVGPAGAKFVITNNNASGGYLTFLQLRGKRVMDRGTTQHEARDSTSVTAYGEHVALIDMPYQGDDGVGQGAADYLLAKYKDPMAQIRSVVVFGGTTALLTQILTRDISDQLTISETVTGAGGDYFINGEELRVLASGHAQATYMLYPAQDPFLGTYWVLGTSTLGTNTTPAPF